MVSGLRQRAITFGVHKHQRSHFTKTQLYWKLSNFSSWIKSVAASSRLKRLWSLYVFTLSLSISRSRTAGLSHLEWCSACTCLVHTQLANMSLFSSSFFIYLQASTTTCAQGETTVSLIRSAGRTVQPAGSGNVFKQEWTWKVNNVCSHEASRSPSGAHWHRVSQPSNSKHTTLLHHQKNKNNEKSWNPHTSFISAGTQRIRYTLKVRAPRFTEKAIHQKQNKTKQKRTQICKCSTFKGKLLFSDVTVWRSITLDTLKISSGWRFPTMLQNQNSLLVFFKS